MVCCKGVFDHEGSGVCISDVCVNTVNRARRTLIKSLTATALLAVWSRRAPPEQTSENNVNLYADDNLAAYGFPDGHPFGIDRQGEFLREVAARGLLDSVTRPASRAASRAEITRFHSAEYVELVATAAARGLSTLDGGDTPVFPGMYDTAAHVVGAALDGLAQVMDGRCRHTMQAIGGLHHAARDHAAGFCVFNDLGVVIETLRQVYGVQRVAYLDIDVHHGDGVFYAFEDDPDLIFADIHQDSNTLYPGTGRADETGTGEAAGTKLNIELPPFSGDAAFLQAWERVEAHCRAFAPEFFVFQCGADGLQGDPLAQLDYTPAVHAHATRRLIALADEFADGRLMAFGGGGYHRDNLAQAWTNVLAELVTGSEPA